MRLQEFYLIKKRYGRNVCTEFLIKKTVVIDCVDRWNNKPIDDILKLKSTFNDSIVSKKKKNDCEKIIELLRNNTTITTM